jgi:hypothetical protein
MADVNINIFTNKIYKQGASTVVPGFIQGEEPTPINPSGSGGASEFVPYVGATENFDLGEFGMSAGFFKLDTTPTNTPTDQGTFYWDEDDNTVDIVLNGYIMKVGEDLFYPVKNQTGSSIAKGTNVRFAGTVGGSGRLLIEPYLADGTYATSRYMGVTAETIGNGEDGKVLWFGRIRGINTNSFNEGDILYASTTSAGGFQTTLPVAPNNIVEVCAVVTKSVNQGVIFVRPQFLGGSGGSIGAGAGLSIDDNGNIQLGNDGTGIVDFTNSSDFPNDIRFKAIANDNTKIFGSEVYGTIEPDIGAFIYSIVSETSGSYQITSSIGLDNAYLEIRNDDGVGSMKITDLAESKGLEELADYSANKTDFSYITPAWIKAQTGYNATVPQYFTHDGSGNFEWVDI